MLKTPYFQGFNKLCGRTPKSTASKAQAALDEIRKNSVGQLTLLYSEWVQAEKIPIRENERDRLFNTVVTFWAMLWQAFTDGPLREAVRLVQASHALGESKISNATSSYSDARKRLQLSTLETINLRLTQSHCVQNDLLGERRIRVVDSTGIQIEDTFRNQAEYPQPSNQKEGCGFPVIQLTGLFSLNEGYLNHHICSPMDAHEGGMFDTELSGHLNAGDVLVADRLFGSYARIAALKQTGVDVIMRLHCSREWPGSAKGDEVVLTWKRPGFSASAPHYTREQWEKIPQTLTVRYIRKRIVCKGFRDREIILVSTIMDVAAQKLLAVYERRWDIELCFDDIKTTMGMEFIRAKSPEMAQKMIQMYAIAYNLIRITINKAAKLKSKASHRISFKGAIDSIKCYCAQLAATPPGKRSKVIQKLLEVVAEEVLPDRPNRIEPRVRKRRPKNFPLMTKPRDVLKAEILKQMCA